MNMFPATFTRKHFRYSGSTTTLIQGFTLRPTAACGTLIKQHPISFALPLAKRLLTSVPAGVNVQ